ncbi:hypothetical protein AYI70_g857 [Smittium culicis]|uniref:Uncharacterized protein n=1 Tax=Smittium culicis TaxID=133412 RepID=A0A1R1YF43_9FUNG|nr:hypothetical protein AYI70_g9955 [Smittium culicis]OMJ25504.1 hypothetical protein AYI70_g857 [Smittium culicis]
METHQRKLNVFATVNKSSKECIGSGEMKDSLASYRRDTGTEGEENGDRGKINKYQSVAGGLNEYYDRGVSTVSAKSRYGGYDDVVRGGGGGGITKAEKAGIRNEKVQGKSGENVEGINDSNHNIQTDKNECRSSNEFEDIFESILRCCFEWELGEAYSKKNYSEYFKSYYPRDKRARTSYAKAFEDFNNSDNIKRNIYSGGLLVYNSYDAETIVEKNGRTYRDCHSSVIGTKAGSARDSIADEGFDNCNGKEYLVERFTSGYYRKEPNSSSKVTLVSRDLSIQPETSESSNRDFICLDIDLNARNGNVGKFSYDDDSYDDDDDMPIFTKHSGTFNTKNSGSSLLDKLKANSYGTSNILEIDDSDFLEASDNNDEVPSIFKNFEEVNSKILYNRDAGSDDSINILAEARNVDKAIQIGNLEKTKYSDNMVGKSNWSTNCALDLLNDINRKAFKSFEQDSKNHLGKPGTDEYLGMNVSQYSFMSALSNSTGTTAPIFASEVGQNWAGGEKTEAVELKYVNSGSSSYNKKINRYYRPGGNYDSLLKLESKMHERLGGSKNIVDGDLMESKKSGVGKFLKKTGNYLKTRGSIIFNKQQEDTDSDIFNGDKGVVKNRKSRVLSNFRSSIDFSKVIRSDWEKTDIEPTKSLRKGHKSMLNFNKFKSDANINFKKEKLVDGRSGIVKSLFKIINIK